MSRRNHTLHVRNISTRATYEDLKKEFERYGRVLDVTIPTNYYTREPKGYAFIEFEDHRDASEAVQELHEKSFMNHTLHIEFARGTRKTSDQMRNPILELVLPVQEEAIRDMTTINMTDIKVGTVADTAEIDTVMKDYQVDRVMVHPHHWIRTKYWKWQPK
ncbi:hypothetical protein SNEBB_009738 [Seison nebaliae]|nr:hypothetical protein SNEBB_009738 [Seison nebaliae]